MFSIPSCLIGLPHFMITKFSGYCLPFGVETCFLWIDSLILKFVNSYFSNFSVTSLKIKMNPGLLCCDFLIHPLFKCESQSVVSNSLRPHGLYSPWNSPGQNTGVGSLFLLRGIFPTQESNPGLPHCRHILFKYSCLKRELK